MIGLYLQVPFWLVSISKTLYDWTLFTNLLMIGLYLQADLWLVSICKPPHDWSLFVSPLMIGLYSKVAFQKFFFFLLTFWIGNFSPEAFNIHLQHICQRVTVYLYSRKSWSFAYVFRVFPSIVHNVHLLFTARKFNMFLSCSSFSNKPKSA